MTHYESIVQARSRGEKKFALLLDPDKVGIGDLDTLMMAINTAGVDYLFVGGSLLISQWFDQCVAEIRKRSTIPIIIFPGDTFQLSHKADALLFLSLISGRNPELLIGKQVVAAPYLKASNLEVISCGYMLVDGGVPTTVSYMSSTQPIPSDKDDIAVCTAVAGEMLGMKSVYLDAGSGAILPVSESMIRAVRAAINIPLIVGGGIQTPEKAITNIRAGADMIVVGNAVEKDPTLIQEIADAVHSVQTVSS